MPFLPASHPPSHPHSLSPSLLLKGAAFMWAAINIQDSTASSILITLTQIFVWTFNSPVSRSEEGREGGRDRRPCVDHRSDFYVICSKDEDELHARSPPLPLPSFLPPSLQHDHQLLEARPAGSRRRRPDLRAAHPR